LVDEILILVAAKKLLALLENLSAGSRNRADASIRTNTPDGFRPRTTWR
jgi:hypothetical protein